MRSCDEEEQRPKQDIPFSPLGGGNGGGHEVTLGEWEPVNGETCDGRGEDGAEGPVEDGGGGQGCSPSWGGLRV